jgi:hypothetical protein
MNELIKQFAVECAQTNLDAANFDYEKFAKLLVADISNFMDARQEARDVPKVAWAIMDRYGVEYHRYVDNRGIWHYTLKDTV